MRAKLEAYSHIIVPKPGLLRLDSQPREKLRAVLASYLGHFRHANSQRLIAALWKRYSWLSELFKNYTEPLIPRWEPPIVTSLLSQWSYFTVMWPNTLILMQVGNRLKCLDQKIDVSMRQQNNLLKLLQKDNISYILVVEEGYLQVGLKRRVLREHYLF